MFSNRSVDIHRFAMVPDAEVPRSRFRIEKAHKTTFDGGLLIPIFLEECLPGDAWRVSMTAFCRLSTPLFPLMDNLHLESFFFFVPMRLVWTNFKKFMGEQVNPADSISFTIPQQVSPVGGYAVGSLQDYFGLPTVGQVAGGNTVSHNALPLRCFNLIYNEWFRDQNLINSLTVDLGDGPDATPSVTYANRRRGKRHDYFTSALPWPQKGGTAVSLPLGTSAPVRTSATGLVTGVQTAMRGRLATTGAFPGAANALTIDTAGVVATTGSALAAITGIYPENLYADLSTATAATINQLRQAISIQELLEKDARGGTRYQEMVRVHFKVMPQDARLQRPEYCGGGSSPISINPVSQTSGTSATGTTTPLGTLGGLGTGVAHHGCSVVCSEHGYLIGIVNVRADLSYQQGLRKLWSRSTRYDFYLPVFAALGEQAILNKEIYCDGSVNDNNVFGYQERWAELRYSPSMITGLFRSTSAGTIDGWHAAQKFTALPTLNQTFIDDTPPLSRLIAVGAAANGQQLLFDSVFSMDVTRPIPMYSVPGLKLGF